MAEKMKKGDRDFFGSGGVDPYSRQLQQQPVVQKIRKGLGQTTVIPKAVGGAMVDLASAPGKIYTDSMKRGFLPAIGSAAAAGNQQGINAIKGLGNMLYNSGAEVAEGATAAVEGIKNIDATMKGTPPAQDQGNIDEQFAEGEKQFASLDGIDAQLAPTSSDPKPAEPLPQGISQLDLGGNPIFKNDQLSAEDQKKYGKAIYSDSALGATTQGFDESKGGISSIETSGDYERDFGGSGGIDTTPREMAIQILKTMPYGTPGDRQKRRTRLAEANMLLGIGEQDFNQYNSNRQYGLDKLRAEKPESQVGRYKTIAGYDTYDEEGIKTGEVPATIFDSTSGQFVQQGMDLKDMPSIPSEGQAILDEFKAGEDTPERRAKYKAAFDRVMANLSTPTQE
jgi:hypothetical protein